MNRVPATALLSGIARLAFFNRSGFAAIGNTREAFLASLSPLLAFLLVGGTLEGLATGWHAGLANGLQTLCVLLGQPVASNLYARLWKRQEVWLRYATAMNWCQLAIPVVGIGFTMAALFFGAVGPSPRMVAYGLLGAILIYAVVLNWFLAWRGLNLSAWQAALFVLLVTVTLALVLAIPAAVRVAQTGAVPNVAT